MVRTVRPSAAIALPPPSPGSTACSSSPPAPSSIPFSPTHLPPRRRIAAVRTAACYVTAAAAASAAGEDHAVLHHTTQPASAAPSFIAVKEDFPLLIIAEDVEEEALATLTRNKLSGMIKVAATKAPSFGEQKTQCLEDIAIITGGTVVREDMGYTLEDSGKEVLGSASKVVIKKDSTLIVTDGSTLHAVEKRVAQIKGQVEMFAH